ncbi:hypothetical protein FB192DRAFT_1124655 [Mucor lusitanicus]|uniref:Uncharacterized protein n=1 Tax=Mucor circinelloides f. lusitanicus TaxID=29924 RepID=A0A8H4F007_MUCCL|nr:hypothetical protein FB192DRAFT_1124655 [Mucor lusitanicus]
MLKSHCPIGLLHSHDCLTCVLISSSSSLICSNNQNYQNQAKLLILLPTYCNVKTTLLHNAASTSIQKQAILLYLCCLRLNTISKLTTTYKAKLCHIYCLYSISRPCKNVSINAVSYPYKSKRTLFKMSIILHTNLYKLLYTIIDSHINS